VQFAVYEVIGEPPSVAGTPKAIVTLALPALATTAAGDPGTVADGSPLLVVAPPPPPPPQAARWVTIIAAHRL
jgi:hypothetical protein